MPIRIQSITVNDIVDKRALILNAGIARVLSIGNDWQTIRIGIRYGSLDFGASLGTGNRFYVGMLSEPSAGLANGPLGDSTSHWVGARVSGTINHSISTSPHYTGMNFIAIKKIGATETGSSGIFTALMSAVPTIRNLMIVEIVKGSPNFTVRGVCVNAHAGMVDTSKDLLIGAVELPGTMTNVRDFINGVVGSGYSGSSDTSVAVDEADGQLNALCVAWNRSLVPLILSDVMWAQMA